MLKNHKDKKFQHRRPIVFLFALFVVLLNTGCSEQGKTQNTELVISAASSLTNVFQELGIRFEEKNPGTKIIFNFSSSSQLAAQLLEGIDSDIFASANEGQMEILQNAGEIMGTATIFCTNSLTIGVPTENPYRITDLSDLTKPNIRLVLAAPNTPIREYSDLIVKKYLPPNDQISLYNNLVSEEPNVRQVVTKIALGEADAGIIYSSDITPDISSFVSAIPIPRENNIIARYPIAILNRTNHINLAEDFINFLVSDEGQEIFQKWGFGQKP